MFQGDVVHHLIVPETNRFCLFTMAFRNLDDLVDFCRFRRPEVQR